MRYVELPPARALAPWVECLWALEAPAPEPGDPVEPVLPDGCTELVFHVGAPFRRRTLGRSDGATQYRSAVVGQIESALLLEPTGVVGLVGVRLRPEAAGAFLGVAARELTGTSARLDEVLASASPAFEDAVYAGDDLVAALARLEIRLADHASTRALPDERVQRAVALARAAGGACDVAALAATAGLSPRQLERRFADEVGVTPKRFLRLLRVHRAAQLLQKGVRAVDAALTCGYYDESHLHRDFREVAGAPPARWAASEHAFADRLLG